MRITVLLSHPFVMPCQVASMAGKAGLPFLCTTPGVTGSGERWGRSKDMTALQICSRSHLELDQASQAFICEMDIFQYGCFQNKHLCFAAEMLDAISHTTSSCPRQSCMGSPTQGTPLPAETWMAPQHAALMKDFGFNKPANCDTFAFHQKSPS